MYIIHATLISLWNYDDELMLLMFLEYRHHLTKSNVFRCVICFTGYFCLLPFKDLRIIIFAEEGDRVE